MFKKLIQITIIKSQFNKINTNNDILSKIYI